MNISKRTKTILLTCCALLLLSAGIFAGAFATFHIIRTNPDILPKEKLYTSGSFMWTAYNIATASEAATTIVYGTLMPKEDIIISERISPNGNSLVNYYRDANIQVLRIIKGKKNAEKIRYFEMSNYESDEVSHTYYGVRFLEEGKNYIFFLGDTNSYLSPATVVEVDENGFVLPTWDMRIENEAQAQSDDTLPIPLEDYIAEIQKYLD